jgi:hypothetical protein
MNSAPIRVVTYTGCCLYSCCFCGLTSNSSEAQKVSEGVQLAQPDHRERYAISNILPYLQDEPVDETAQAPYTKDDDVKMATLSIAEAVSRNIKKYAKSYAAAFKVDCERRPYHAGTITGIDLGHQVVLVTARHVLERDQNNPCDEDNMIYAAADGKVDQLNRLQTAALTLPNGKPLDALVFVPETHRPEQIIDEAVPLHDVVRAPIRTDYYFGACGFPHTKNRRKGKELSRRPYGYFGKLASDQIAVSEGYDPQFHFSIEINLKKVYGRGLKEVKAANPEGISGGPVFLVHDFSSSVSMGPKLAGIVIARSSNSKALICIRADVVADMAIERFRIGG